MPSIVMRAPADSLIEQTNRLVVRRQIEYAAALRAPWGVSESAYNARDLDFTYQYSNFGVPGLGLKRGLADNAVVAPYATALASMIDPQAAARNFESLEAIGARGRYGFYRGAGLHAGPGPGRRARRHRARVHGAPPRDDDHRHRRCLAGWRDAQPLPRRADRPGDGAPSAGARASRSHDDPAVGLGDDVGGQDPRGRRTRRPANGQSVERHAGHPAALERPLHRDAYGRRIRIQHLARPGGDPLARGRHLRRLGLLRLPEGRRERRGVVGGVPADRSRARAYEVTFNEDRAEFSRRRRRRWRPRSRCWSPPKTMRKCAA